MAIERLVYAVKFWEMGYRGLLELLPLKKAGLRQIILLHVIPREEVAYVPFGGFLKERALELKEAAKLKLQNWEKEIQGAGLASKSIVKIGEPLPQILETVEEEGAELLVLGKVKVEKFFSSEITHQLVMRCKVPVLLYCHSLLKEPEGVPIPLEHSGIFTRVLLATDFSENFRRAGLFLVNLKPLLERLYLIYILKSSKISGMNEEEVHRLEEELKGRLREELLFFQKQGIEGDFYLGLGDEPGYEILEFARLKNLSLIVLGKTGKGRLQKLLLGSVTDYLLKEAELPLLIVP